MIGSHATDPAQKVLDLKRRRLHAWAMNLIALHRTPTMCRRVPAWKRMRLSASRGLMKS
jgi:hypothetical protein